MKGSREKKISENEIEGDDFDKLNQINRISYETPNLSSIINKTGSGLVREET